MAVDYKPLNRQQDFSVDQKKSLKKVFQAAEASALVDPASSTITRTDVHTILAGYWDGDARHDIQALMKEIRSAISATDNARNIDSVVGAFRMTGNKKRVIRTMANAVIAQIV